MQGVISDKDDKFLSEMLTYRNALSHGFEPDDFEAKRVKDLIVAAKKLRRAAATPVHAGTVLDARADLLDPLDVPARLDELRAMQDGWLGNGSKAPSHTGLDWLSASFERQFPGDLPLPHMFATLEGGIQAEWSISTASLDLEIDLNRHNGHGLFFYHGHDTESQYELSFDLDDANDWERLSNQIRQPLEAGA